MRQAKPRNQASDTSETGPVQLPVVGQAAARAAPRRGKTATAPVVAFVSLGCAKNLVDSEKMLGQLAESGAMLTGDEDAADTVVVNTCGFLESSRTEALQIIRELGERKRAGRLKRIVVAGCLVQRDGESLRAAAPEIDALVGVNNRDDVVQAVWRLDRDAAVDRYLGDYHGQSWNDRGRLRLTPRHYGYLRISEGCNQKCTFCTIPGIRGPMHSKSPDELLREARELADDGAKEIILIGQDTTSYGLDLTAAADRAAPGAVYLKGGLVPAEGELSLPGLLRRLDRELDAARWIRLMYVYPSVLTDAIIDAIAECPRIVKYIDIPLQHIDDPVLKRMARRVTRRQTEALLEKLLRRIPDVTIRTTFIVGFPGETEEEFSTLLDFVRGFRFDALGAFQYSHEPDTPAGRMPDQVPATVKQERYDRLMSMQQEIAWGIAREQVGRQMDVVVDTADGERVVARHSGQAPDVDPVCLLPAGSGKVGEWLPVRCAGTLEYDLCCDPLSSNTRPLERTRSR